MAPRHRCKPLTCPACGHGRALKERLDRLDALEDEEEFAYRALPWWQKDSGLVAIAAISGFSVVGVLALIAPTADPKKRKRS